MKELEVYISSYFGANQQYSKELSTFFKETTLKKDELHTKLAQHNASMSFIRKGDLRVYSYHEGKEITQWISCQGEFVADLSSMVFQSPARWNIQALTDCELYSISAADYQRIATIIPEWEHLEKLFLAKCFVILEERVKGFIALSAEERYNKLFQDKQELFNKIPLQYLASMLGMTPETFSRIRRKTIS